MMGLPCKFSKELGSTVDPYILGGQQVSCIKKVVLHDREVQTSRHREEFKYSATKNGCFSMYRARV